MNRGTCLYSRPFSVSGKAAAPPGAVPIHPFVIVLFKCGSGSDGEFDPSDVEHVGPEEDLLDADTIRPCQAVHFYWGMKDEAVYTGVGEWAYCDKFFDLPVGELEGWYYYNIDKHKRDDFDDITCGLFTAALEKYGGDAESVRDHYEFRCGKACCFFDSGTEGLHRKAQ